MPLPLDHDSRSLLDLRDFFRPQVDKLIAACAARDVKIVPFFTVRGPVTQAKLWCQSRSIAEVAAARIRMAGATKLSILLKNEYTNRGKWATNALPGESWHQFGEAVDCYVDRDGKAIWDPLDPGYEVYAAEAEKLGLTAGAHWAAHKDTDHVQFSKDGSPLDGGVTWPEIETKMEALYAL